MDLDRRIASFDVFLCVSEVAEHARDPCQMFLPYRKLDLMKNAVAAFVYKNVRSWNAATYRGRGARKKTNCKEQFWMYELRDEKKITCSFLTKSH
jgi:hypothetical protein